MEMILIQSLYFVTIAGHKSSRSRGQRNTLCAIAIRWDFSNTTQTGRTVSDICNSTEISDWSQCDVGFRDLHSCAPPTLSSRQMIPYDGMLCNVYNSAWDVVVGVFAGYGPSVFRGYSNPIPKSVRVLVRLYGSVRQCLNLDDQMNSFERIKITTSVLILPTGQKPGVE